MSNRAWVTLATNDSYGLGALVLAHSLRRAGSAHPAVVLVTPAVTDTMRDRLSAVFAEVITVDVLDSRDATHLALLQRPELGITFTKIHCWSLTQYEKCVFLDADTLIIQNCDELFEREELSAAPDVGWPDCFNSGVFVFVPSADTYGRLIAFAQQHGSFDGGDQGLLNAFFSDWAHGDINKHLPFLYNVTSAAFYSYLPALKHFGPDLKIIHFIGAAKPWLQPYNWESHSVDAPAEHLRQLLQQWWDLFVGQVHTQLDTAMGRTVEVAVEEVPPVLSPKEVQHYYSPKLDAASEFPWHHPDVQTKKEECKEQIDMSQFYDPWKNYRGSLQTYPDHSSSRHAEYHPAQENKGVNPHIWNYQPIQQIYSQFQTQEVIQPHIEQQTHQIENVDKTNNYQYQNQEQSRHTHNDLQTHYDHTQKSQETHTHHHQHIQNSQQQNNEHQIRDQDQQLYQDHSQQHAHNHNHSFHYQPHNQDNSQSIQVQYPPHNQTHKESHHVTHPEQNNHQGHNHVDPHVSSADHSPKQNEYRSEAHNYGYINLDVNAIVQERTERVYSLHQDYQLASGSRRRNRQNHGENTLHLNCDEVTNGHVSDIDSDNEDFRPRHPYDGFYLRHTSTINSRGHKICTHEVPPTPSPSPPLSDSLPQLVSSSSAEDIVSASNGHDHTGVAGNLARVVPGEGGYQRDALDELTRRQGWEAGNIDYMGADSFDNIWAKISQTLNQPRTSPPKQPSPPRKDPSPPKEQTQPEPPKEVATVESPALVEPAAPMPADAPGPPEIPAPVSADASTPAVPVAAVEAPAPVEVPAAVEAPAPVAIPASPAVSTPAETTVAPAVSTPTDAPAAPIVSAPVETIEPAVTPAPAEAPAPSETSASVESSTPVAPDAPTPVEASAAVEAPVPVETPAAVEVPAPVEAPAPVEVPAPAVEPSAPTEAPAVKEISTEAAAPASAVIEAPLVVAAVPASEAPAVVETVPASFKAPKTESAPAEPAAVPTATEPPKAVEESVPKVDVPTAEAAAPEAPKEEVKEKTEPTVPPTPPVTPKSTPEASTPVTEAAPIVEAASETQATPAPAEAPKATEIDKADPASPAPAAVAPESAKTEATPEKALETSTLTTASTDSPPLVQTPSKEVAPAVPAVKSGERRKVEKLQLSPPAAADASATPECELDAAALAQSIIASELSTCVTSPSPPADPVSPPPPAQAKRLSAEGPEVPTPPVSLAQIGVNPKGKSSTAARIESSVSEKAEPTSPATPTSPDTPTTPCTPGTPSTPTEAPKKKIVKKVVKKEKEGGSSGDAAGPVPPPRKKEKKPKEK